MSYHLHHNGQELGVFVIEELRRRRQSGELSGAELLWKEGMQDWQTLDSVLAGAGMAAPGAASPPPIPVAQKSRPRKPLVWALAGLGVLMIAGLLVAGFLGFRFYKRIQRTVLLSNQDATDVASRQVTVRSTSLTEADSLKRAKAFRIRQWVNGYQERGDHSIPCHEEVEKMLTLWIESTYGTAPTNEPPLEQICDRLAASARCNDPLVLSILGANATDVHEKIRRYETALDAYERSPHLAYPKLNATMNLMAEVKDDQKRFATLFNKAMRLFDLCFSDGSFRPEDQDEIAEIFIYGWGSPLVNRSRDGIHGSAERAGPGYQWLYHVLQGEYQIAQAWKARGSGFANTVTEDGMKGFTTHLDSARTNLTKAWKLRPDLPIAPCRMIYVAMGQSDAAEMRTWFDRTLAAQVDYPDAWVQMRWGLRPRWHGSLDAMLSLGKSALNTKRFDTDVPRIIFDSVSDIESEMRLAHGQHIYGREDIWPLLQQMYEGYIAEPKANELRPGWQSTYTAVAFLAGNYSVAKTQLEALKWQPLTQSFCNWGSDLSLLPLEVAARTSTIGPRIDEAEGHYRRSQTAEALRGYSELKDAADLDERTRQFISHRLASLALEQKLDNGEWISLLPKTTNEPGWIVAKGSVKCLPDGAVEVEANKFGHMLYCLARVGTNVEVKGEFEIVKSSNGAFQAGLVMGLPNPDDTDWYAFVMKYNEAEKQVVSISQGWSRRRISQPAELKSDRNVFSFRFQGGKASTTLNGTTVFAGVEPTREMQLRLNHCLLGLGAYNDMNQTVIRYRGVQARRLVRL
ncbi:MAG: hypothetical protein JWM16_1558 [Verrucomicrobiales bacterium]|nr:hypothetical protein [Verrucomicrobiales bacterium]